MPGGRRFSPQALARPLARRESKTRYGGKAYLYSHRFSAGSYPDNSKRREPETTRVVPGAWHDGEGWEGTWDVQTSPAVPSPYGLVNSSKSSHGPAGAVAYKRRKADTRGIPGIAKRRISNMVCGLYAERGKANVGFATLTVPPLTPEENQAVNENYGAINQRCLERLKRRVEAQGGEWLAVAAYEIQEKRLERWGTVALHTHVVYQARPATGGPWWLTIADWENAWAEALENFLGHPVDRKALTNVQKARADLAFELAKYQTKGSAVIERVREMGRASELPGQWWTASKALKEIDRQSTIGLSSEQVEFLLTYHHKLQEVDALRARPICIQLQEREIQVGIAGFFVDGVAMGVFLAETGDRPQEMPPATAPSITPPPSQVDGLLAAALARGDFGEVERLVELADRVYPDVGAAQAEQSHRDFEWVCSTVQARRADRWGRFVDALALARHQKPFKHAVRAV